LNASRPPTRRALSCAIVLGLSAAAFARTAQADDDADGVYGRLNGDLDLRLSAGASFARGGPSLAASISALYLSSAGLYAHYTDALGASSPAIVRSISTGLVIEPLFLGRFATDFEHGPARFDLTLDSFAIGLGAFWAEPRNQPLDPTPGLEFWLGLGFPLLPQATGPVLNLRATLRARPTALDGTEPFHLIDQGALLTLTLTWRHILPVNIVDVADRAER